MLERVASRWCVDEAEDSAALSGLVGFWCDAACVRGIYNALHTIEMRREWETVSIDNLHGLVALFGWLGRFLIILLVLCGIIPRCESDCYCSRRKGGASSQGRGRCMGTYFVCT